jgi:hypothetical protein
VLNDLTFFSYTSIDSITELMFQNIHLVGQEISNQSIIYMEFGFTKNCAQIHCYKIEIRLIGYKMAFNSIITVLMNNKSQ